MLRSKEAETRGDKFLAELTLAEIYGSYEYPFNIPILVEDRFLLQKLYQSSGSLTREHQKLLEENGFPRIPSIAAYLKTKGSEFIIPGLTPSLAFWVPQRMERELLVEVANSLATNKKPLILEVEADTALTSKLLVSETGLSVRAVDSKGDRFSLLPPVFGDLKTEVSSVWDLVLKYGPKYSPEVSNRIQDQLEAIKKHEFKAKLNKEEIMENWKERKKEYKRSSYLAKMALKWLQEVTSLPDIDSPVDIAIYSSGAKGGAFETVAIRDGIRPKVIVYARQSSLRIPEDWQDKYNQTQILRNSFTGFDPGSRYRTVSVWNTLSKSYWKDHIYNLPPSFTTEILVQLRRDVRINGLPSLALPSYYFDDEVLELLAQYGCAEAFQQGINKAKTQFIQK